MLIVTYHAISDHSSPVCTSERQLRRDLGALRAARFAFVSLDDCLAWMQGDRTLPNRSVAVTFDDGYRSVAERALPILEELGIPATVYVVAGRLGLDNDWPGQWRSVPRMPLMDVDELGLLTAAGMTLGVHSWSHPVLPEVGDHDLVNETDGARAHLERATGCELHHFAYPYGRYGARERRAAQETYRSATGTRPDIVTRRNDPHALPRVDAHDVRVALRLGIHDTATLRPYLASRRWLRYARTRIGGRSR